jgi:hypothetical protein
VGAFSFAGALATEVAAGLDPDPDLTTCSWDPGFPSSVSFPGTLAGDLDGAAAALCRDGPAYFGTHAGARWTVEAISEGAVLGSCGPTCAARARTVVTGDLLPDPSAPTEFRGALVEQLTSSAGDCGGCFLPCAARYELTGAIRGEPEEP